MPGTVLGAGDKAVNETEKASVLTESTFLGMTQDIGNGSEYRLECQCSKLKVAAKPDVPPIKR